VHDEARRTGTDDENTGDAVEKLLLAYEELASNALRHGRRPVRATVTAVGSSWLLDVSDHGWWTAGGRKSVWACIDGR
jgi:hypothetical protein